MFYTTKWKCVLGHCVWPATKAAKIKGGGVRKEPAHESIWGGTANFFEIFNCDQEFRYRALDYAYEYVLSGRRNLQKKYFRIGLSENSITFFPVSYTHLPLPTLLLV